MMADHSDQHSVQGSEKHLGYCLGNLMVHLKVDLVVDQMVDLKVDMMMDLKVDLLLRI